LAAVNTNPKSAAVILAISQQAWKRLVGGSSLSSVDAAQHVGDFSSRPTKSAADSSAAENPGCFCLRSLRTYSMFSALSSVLTAAIVIPG
jgi:hypothetical protein